ncbi:MAG: DinB family protein [Chloroflexota bacterium]
MGIGPERLLRHMVWADQALIAFLRAAEPRALDAYNGDPAWTVRTIVHHLVEAADYYVFRITGAHVDAPGEEIALPRSPDDLELLGRQLAVFDAALLGCASLDDEVLAYTRRDGTQVRWHRSTILSQAIHHATEHRTQIAAALVASGLPGPDLDELDLWAVELHAG